MYQKLVEEPLSRSYESNEGVFSDALGPLDTYYPLVPVTDGETAVLRTGSRVPYRAPGNLANRFATGLSPDYDAGMAALQDRISAAFRTNDRAALVQSLQEDGLLQPLKQDQRVPTYMDAENRPHPYIDYSGKRYQAARVEISPERLISNGSGSTTYVPPKAALLPTWLSRELDPILNGAPEGWRNQNVFNRIMSAVNQIALSGPADAIFHAHNLLGSMVANTPLSAKALSKKP